MTEVVRPRDRDGFETAVICALKHEADAVEASFDEFWDDNGDPYGKAPGDTNSYTTGVIGRHNVVLAVMPGMGKGSAASVAASIRSSFGGIKLALVVGICAGVPNDSDDDYQMLLGDVVISKGVIQYDFGRRFDSSFKRKTNVEESFGRPAPELRSLLAKLQTARSRKRLQDNTCGFLTDIMEKTRAQYPGAVEDKLYKSTYRHMHHDASACTICARCEVEDASACDEALKSSCLQLGCDENKLVCRGRLERAMKEIRSGKAAEQRPGIHYGLIASADTVMKSGKQRDKIAAEEGVIAFEMEGAGVWENLPTIVIKGVCDYGDSHKNKAWQSYAAATAAACMKAFLSEWTSTSQSQILPTGHWLVPFGRNDKFVGRDSHLAELMSKLHPENNKDDCQRVAVDGLGGVGKTQIALEAAFKLQKLHPYLSVFWVPAIDTTSFERAYREIGQKLRIAGINDEKADVKLLVKMALTQESAGSWLLIVDNADDIDMLYNKGNKVGESGGSLALAEYLPFSRKGSILVTTRNHKIAVKLAGVNVIKVEEMTLDDSLELLQASLSKTSLMGEQDRMTELLDLLTHLPLAIKQAAAFMNENTTSVSEYLGMYESSAEVDLLSIDFEDQGRYQGTQNPIATTWLISFHHILDRDPLAAEYLYIMSCMAQQDVPESLLPRDADIKKIPAIGTLQAYAFITSRKGQHSYYMHRLVRIVVRNWLKRQGILHMWTGKTLKHIDKTFPLSEHENRDVWTGYLPHALCILDYQDYSRGDEESQRNLLFEVGICFCFLGKDMEAEQMLQQAMKLREKALGKKHLETIRSVRWLAITLYNQSKYKNAERLYKEILELLEKSHGTTHPDTVCTMSDLAATLSKQGQYKKAEKMGLQCLQLQEKVLGREHPDTLNTLSSLAATLCSQGQYEEAGKMGLQCLHLQEKVLGREHPRTLSAMSSLAATLHRQGRYEEAKKKYLQCLKLQEKVLGREHPDTLYTMSSLAATLCSQGQYEEAGKMSLQCLKLQEKVLGREHPQTLSAMSSLAATLHRQGRYEEAKKKYLQCLKLQEKVLGREHPQTLSTMSSLAATLCSQGQYEEAGKMSLQCLKLQEKVLGREHPQTLSAMSSLAATLHRQGRYEEAKKKYLQCLKLREKVLGREHPDTLSTMSSLAATLCSQGQYEEAGKMSLQCLKLQEKVLGREHPDILSAMSSLAATLYSQGQYEEAGKKYLQCLKLREKVLSREHPDTLYTMSSLAATLCSQGQYEEAGKMSLQCLKLQEKVLGREHPQTLSAMSSLAATLHRQGRYEEAKKKYLQCLKLQEKVLGREHPGTLYTMSSLAATLHCQGQYEEAEKEYLQCLKLQEKVLGREHPNTVQTMSSLAATLHRQGRYEEAEEKYLQCLKLQERVMGEGHPDTALTRANLTLMQQRKEKLLREDDKQSESVDLPTISTHNEATSKRVNPENTSIIETHNSKSTEHIFPGEPSAEPRRSKRLKRN